MNPTTTPARSPLAWVPTLYYAEGLPLWVVLQVSLYLYKSLGVPNEQITRWTGLLGLAWVVKPLWSPFIELIGSNRFVVVLFELLGAAALGLVALTLHLPGFFALSVALLALVAFASATHDIAADGLYIASLDAGAQARYAGWQGAFYNAAKFIAAGGLVVGAGWLEQRMPAAAAWSLTFVALAAMLGAIGLYHLWALPRHAHVRSAGASMGRSARVLAEVVIDFFRKPGIWLWLLFVLLFRCGEAQVSAIAPLFLRDARAVGGLGLSTSEVGWAYGTAGTLAFIAGSIIGGYFAAWLGLRRAMVFLVIGMNLPNVAFFYLSSAMPENLGLITAAIFVENFGFGFGFVGVILFLMQVVSVGRYQTAHYAFGTGFMALSMVIFRGISGDIQKALGYQQFFLWVLVAALPVLLLSLRIVPSANRNDGEGAGAPAAAQG
jgi:PAT family beta-lactamase induction signal transducer AmpG